MEFKVISRRESESKIHYEKAHENKSHIVISINEWDGPLACIPSVECCKDILRLRFDDIDEHYHIVDALFTKQQAKAILDFVDKHYHDIELIIVHCHAGISRSAGVAAALSYILNQNDDAIVKQKPCFNRFVYRTILNEHFKDK